MTDELQTGRALEIARTAESPAQLVALAIMEKTIPDTLNKLLDVQERWEAMRAKRAYDTAMSQFKKDFQPTVFKNSTVDFSTNKGRTHYKYASLADEIEAATTLLAKHGFHVSWETKQAKEEITVSCHVNHSEGHRE